LPPPTVPGGVLAAGSSSHGALDPVVHTRRELRPLHAQS